MRKTALALARAAHAGPALAVTVLSCLLGVAADLSPSQVAMVTSAVLAGQLSVGWSNDLRDRARDAAVGRSDKPLANGEVGVSTVRAACALAVAATVALSLLCGVLAGAVHLLCVASAWTYNLWLKGTLASWLPYAVSFGGLPVFVELVVGSLPPVEVVVGGALLGVAAHLLNVVPDLAQDAATGIRGLPHRLGARTSVVVAVGLLVTVTGLLLATDTVSGRLDGPVVVVVGATVAVLAVLALVGSGRVPFLAAIGIAFTDVMTLVAR
ncbi:MULTISPECIES: UbiA family prenyltransferase [unclassified Knoellia]|uniref:UbiA family prenyltransferase n=1 Tax=Knoellia altitudinis TaxID=3404795 RepID=UPI0036082524